MSATRNINKGSQLPFWIFTAAVFVIGILPSLIQDGMFIDGVQYAAVSKNWANGLGTFWSPHISQNWSQNFNSMGSDVFLENPPLVYAIQGIFFKIFGDSMYTERIYGLFTALLAAFFIVRIWKLATKHNLSLHKLSWLPVLVWVSIPIVFRSYQMNIQENTMGIFILLSVYMVLKGLENRTYSFLYIILGGIFIFLATLSKGITGSFTLVCVILYWLAGGRIKFPRALLYTVILAVVPFLLYLLLLSNDQAKESLSFYYQSRLLERINNDPVVDTHFHILLRLLLDLLPALLISILVFLLRRKKVSLSKYPEERRSILFFLLLGLAGSAPLALTLVQRDFYLGPSLPYFALAISLFLAIYLWDVFREFELKSRAFNGFRILGLFLLLGGIVYTGMMIGKTGRDHDILHDTYLIGEFVEEGSRVRLEAAHENPMSHWNLELYLTRYFEISLGEELEKTDYIIQDDFASPPERQEFELLPLNTRTYHLYRRRN